VSGLFIGPTPEESRGGPVKPFRRRGHHWRVNPGAAGRAL